MKDTIDPSRPWAIPETGDCPVADALRLLGGKHAAKVLHCLVAGEMHFLELTRAMPDISRKVLTAQLGEFEHTGLVSRVEKQDARRRVGYSLTPKGRALAVILAQLYDWGLTYGPARIEPSGQQGRPDEG